MDQDSYNFGYLQARYLEQSRDKILQLLHQALEASTLDSESALLLRQLLFSVDVIQFLQASAVDAPESVAEIFDIRSYSTNSPASVIFKALLDMMSFSSGGNCKHP